MLAAAGSGLRGVSWTPQIATPVTGRVPGPVVEQIVLRCEGSSQDSVAGYLQALHDMQRWAPEYFPYRLVQTPVWLHSQTKTETTGRRALVYRIDGKFTDDLLGEVQAEEFDSNMLGVALGVERHPYWEALTPTTELTTTGISALGGLFDYTAAPGADVVGDVPARLAELHMYAAAANLSYAWVGFRSVNLHDALTNYDPRAEMTGGTADTDGSMTVDATASGGQRLDVSFATQAGWYSRWYITYDLSGDGATAKRDSGRQLVLLRAYCDAATTAEVRLRSQVLGSEDAFYTEPVAVAATAWTIYPLGTVDLTTFPTIYLEARRTAGAGSFHACSITFVPLDEYFLYMEGTNVIGDNALANAATWTVEPDDYLWGRSSDLSKYVLNVQQIGAGVPLGDGRAVIVGARASKASTLTDTVSCVFTAYPRWLSLRGAE